MVAEALPAKPNRAYGLLARCRSDALSDLPLETHTEKQ